MITVDDRNNFGIARLPHCSCAHSHESLFGKTNRRDWRQQLELKQTITDIWPGQITTGTCQNGYYDWTCKLQATDSNFGPTDDYRRQHSTENSTREIMPFEFILELQASRGHRNHSKISPTRVRGIETSVGILRRPRHSRQHRLGQQDSSTSQEERYLVHLSVEENTQQSSLPRLHMLPPSVSDTEPVKSLRLITSPLSHAFSLMRRISSSDGRRTTVGRPHVPHVALHMEAFSP